MMAKHDTLISDVIRSRGRSWVALGEVREALLAAGIANEDLIHVIGWATRGRSLRFTAFHHMWVSQSTEGDRRRRLDASEIKRVPVPFELWRDIGRAERSELVDVRLDWERGYASLQVIAEPDEWPFMLGVWESIMADVSGLQALVNELACEAGVVPISEKGRRAWIREHGAALNSKQAWAQFSRENNPARRGLLADFMADYREIWPRKQGRPRKVQ
ncbi:MULTISPECIES: hypothetical protein [unclassified Sphingobium]|uniref:hypothetical protein n=1 Tax=unclassified Sphingobium TaxID=2611147 RepID=UPI000D178A04|nr:MULTISPECIES: hypothetical protein [unclassified Sphingobium]PSO12621.1 hypothetical protein C7E20_05805 [Sphingobium sp. AEW4]TWD09802.1 hypothetical protein FB595_104149 [Sphingobium sp. AEW010]TWD26473.1 hypothetical protein FB596_104149 [Sphingobium sp. AEW013]TWD27758.1 hypothetical protein FB594_105179 [Sphingobium sp. AEW001]